MENDYDSWLYVGARVKATAKAKRDNFFCPDASKTVMTVIRVSRSPSCTPCIDLAFINSQGDLETQICSSPDEYLKPAERTSIIEDFVPSMIKQDQS